MERKLTAILCADVFGYSRLMGENEEATHRTLTSHRKIIDSLIAEHHGRFVNSAGDSVLAEFASVVNAVQCAVDIQTTLKAENASLPSERRMEFRIGVNSGDVIVDGEQIYGDGVNVAARLESLAEPGGICISAIVHAQIKNKLALGYEDLSEQRVKNIAEPVRVFRVLPGTGATERTAGRTKAQGTRKYVRSGVFSIAGLAMIAATIIFVQHLSLRPPTPSASIPPAQPPALPLPDTPSIAVLPFTNMSGDPHQEYFSDGITDDLITALSKFPGLFVIARTSAFTYKSRVAKVQDVGRELGVAYVLEGSVRKDSNQVRITAQLVDATTGNELWAERYDRHLREVFTLQDEIVRRIAITLNIHLRLRESGAPGSLPHGTENLDAYDDFLLSNQYLWTLTKEGMAKAREMAEKAIAIDPKYSLAYAQLGFTRVNDLNFGWSHDPQDLERASELAQKAIELDGTNNWPYDLLCMVALRKGQVDRDISYAEHALVLDPNDSFAYQWLALGFNFSGRPDEGLAAAHKAIRLDPQHQEWYLVVVGHSYLAKGQFAEAISALLRHLAHYPNDIGAHTMLVVAYGELGRDREARFQAAEVLRISPQFTSRVGPWENEAVARRYLADLRKAGLK